jgi:hypothetical protein
MTPAERWRAVIEARDLSASEKAVLHVIAYHADAATLEAWPSVQTIASGAGLHQTTARRAIGALIAKEWISRIEQSPGRFSNRYRLQARQPSHGAGVKPSHDARVRDPSNPSAAHGQPSQSARPTLAQRYPNRVIEQGKEHDAPSAPSVWDLGEQLLGNRQYVGRLISNFGEHPVAEAIGKLSILRPQPADCRAYIRGILNRQGGRNDRVEHSDL